MPVKIEHKAIRFDYRIKKKNCNKQNGKPQRLFKE